MPYGPILSLVAVALVIRYCRAPQPLPRAKHVVAGALVATLLVPWVLPWGWALAALVQIGLGAYAHLALTAWQESGVGYGRDGQSPTE